jgi:hypothetical protein
MVALFAKIPPKWEDMFPNGNNKNRERAAQMDRILNMILRQVMRRVVNRGVDAGLNAVTRTGPDASASDRATGQAAARNAKGALRMARRIGRF